MFLKRYECCREEQTQHCDKECPYVKTYRYTIRPNWSQYTPKSNLDKQKCKTLEELLKSAFEPTPLHHDSELAHCLQCHFDDCKIEDWEDKPCHLATGI